jgi:Zn-dependent metalloprotease
MVKSVPNNFNSIFKSVAFLLIFFFSANLLVAQKKQFLSSNYIANSKIMMDSNNKIPVKIKFKEKVQPTLNLFFTEYKKAFDLSGDNEFRLVRQKRDKLGEIHYRYNQYYKGIEIVGAQYILHEKNGYIKSANGRLIHKLNLDVKPALSEETALKAALREVNAKSYMWEESSNETFIKKEQNNPDATFFPKGLLKITCGNKELISENCRLVYRFDIYAQNPIGRYYVDIDAGTGETVNKINRIHNADVSGTGTSLYNGTVSITIDNYGSGQYRLRETDRGDGIQTYDMQNGSNYAAAVDFTDTDNNFTDDNAHAGVSVHWATEGTYDYYSTIHGRNSYDDDGSVLLSYVHTDLEGMGYEDDNNAFWDGSRMTYGDGDGVNCSPLVSIDVAAHEMTHGVTEYEANLVYSYEPGALNESFSDIFATATEFYLEGSGADWLIGEDVTLPAPSFLRSMENPNSGYQPDTYLGDYWYSGIEDNGGVHYNSGVQNYWFYLLSQGGAGTNDNEDPYSVTGIGIDDAAQIAYRNLTVYLTPTSQYLDAREGSIDAAIDIFGSGSEEHQAVLNAWDAVGVYEPVPPEGILVWEGELGGTDYSGDFIQNYLVNHGYTVQYTSTFPPTLIGYDAVFLSFGNYGDGSGNTFFSSAMASLVQSYLESGGKLYLEGGDALGWDQATNSVLDNLLGLSSCDDGGYSNTINGLQGQTGTLTAGMSFTSSTQSSSFYIDKYTPSTGAVAFIESGYGNVGVQNTGITYMQKTFCFSYALSELVDRSSPSTKNDLLSAIINFMEIGTVPDRPDIAVSPSSFTFNVTEGDSDSDVLTITNNALTGGQSLFWNIVDKNPTLLMNDGRSLPVTVSTNINRENGKQIEKLEEIQNKISGRLSSLSNHDGIISNSNESIIKDNRYSSNLLPDFSYVLDDGKVESSLGLGGDQFLWCNRFTPDPGDFPFTLNEVQILFGSGSGVEIGELVDIYVYEDTDGDGNPGTGAVLIGSMKDAPVQFINNANFSVYSITPITINGPGDIIVAVVNRTAGITYAGYPAALDQSSAKGRSWIGIYAGNPPDPPTLPSPTWSTIDAAGYAGNWMIRAYGVKDCNWISQNLLSGTIAAQGIQNITITVNTAGLTAGTYNCNLIISSSDPDEPEIIIPVQLNDVPLPVELISFYSEIKENRINLIWKTANEVNNYGFEIERQLKGSNQWERIGFVEGNGNSNTPRNYAFNDNNPTGGSKFMYRLKQIDTDGKFNYSEEVEAEIQPKQFQLCQNYPNPFNPITKIKFGVPNRSKISIILYSLLGEKVMEIVNGDYEPGLYSVDFNASNLSSGIYIYRLAAGNFVSSKKIMFIK